MIRTNKWLLLTINIVLGGSYIAAILFLIHWVSTGGLGLLGFFIPVGLVVLLTGGWILTDNRKSSAVSHSTYVSYKNELS